MVPLKTSPWQRVFNGAIKQTILMVPSQINVNSETGDITMPTWLARNKGMAAKQGDPTVGGEKSDDGFDWDSWSGGS